MTNPEIQKLTMKQLTRRPSWQQDTAVQLAGGCQKVATDRRPPTFSAASRKEGFIRMSDTAVFSSFTVKVWRKTQMPQGGSVCGCTTGESIVGHGGMQGRHKKLWTWLQAKNF